MKGFSPRLPLGKTFILTCLLWAAAASPALAQWNLSSQHSQLSFVTIKKSDVAEVHSFTKLSGEIDGSGNAQIVIDLASVDTLVPIRDQRMREMLFEVTKFPDARFHAQLDMKQIDAIQAGDSQQLTVKGDLDLHGQTKLLELELVVARLGKDRLQVVTSKPVLINAADFELAAGVEKLRDVVGLPSISNAVPVSFVLQFGK